MFNGKVNRLISLLERTFGWAISDYETLGKMEHHEGGYDLLKIKLGADEGSEATRRLNALAEYLGVEFVESGKVMVRKVKKGKANG